MTGTCTKLLLGTLLVSSFLASPLHAEINPRAVNNDERIRTVPYQKDNIVQFPGMMGVSSMIVFNDDETIMTVAMGDTVAWQAVPDATKRLLFIKPLEGDAVTNLNVATTRRIYNFMLKASPEGNSRLSIFKLRFTYPDDVYSAQELAAAKAHAAMSNLRALEERPELVNQSYGYKGDTGNKPASIRDDGTKTFFEFHGEVPAIFAVKPDGSETLVNHRREGNFIIVDKIARQWTLRNGGAVTCVFNLNMTSRPAVSAAWVSRKTPGAVAVDEHRSGGR
uniref:Type IV secretion protein VirB9 n=2 Tax=Ochrobactrum sp. LM19 TaxID=1449781 RepID=A0A0D5A0E2_9HYPH|nr:type IV secretion protein VirB9 [Ochrobactrum sp. LM19]